LAQTLQTYLALERLKLSKNYTVVIAIIQVFKKKSCVKIKWLAGYRENRDLFLLGLKPWIGWLFQLVVRKCDIFCKSPKPIFCCTFVLAPMG
jgi:hypothetical protein